MGSTIIHEYQQIAEYLLVTHFGLTLNDTDLYDEAMISQLLECNIPVYEAINQLVDKYHLTRIDQNYWSTSAPLLTYENHIVAVFTTVPNNFQIFSIIEG
ncbi:TA system toxin CbtA family protein [Yersinia enterocolitica]|nr:hypothetical protein [Yersinia enterocolitica]EKN3597362.1 hypothetical protein [Yersinia enterocolitica]EKN3940052.1 hypothetical protein [Yersinia enterocolitica]EKN4795403.1 hypothetical protein [Yersinia enterocolitica]EKN4900075.1 hypothetical protein [Yersinia enterocolitica]